ncbi:MAG: DUF6576 domain-containing protein [Bacteroidota bacterium]
MIILTKQDFRNEIIPLLFRRLQIASSVQQIIESLINSKSIKYIDREALEKGQRKTEKELILDKISKNGYDSLSKDEKELLYTTRKQSDNKSPIEIILDKIGKSGYDSLSKDEKELLYTTREQSDDTSSLFTRIIEKLSKL